MTGPVRELAPHHVEPHRGSPTRTARLPYDRGATGTATQNRPSGASLPVCATVEYQRVSARLFAEVGRRGPAEGANIGVWPGLTIYRFTRPGRPRWEEIDCLSVAVVVPARDALIAVGDQHVHGQMKYAVLGGHREIDCRILRASPSHPTLCLVLKIDPQVVCGISARMPELGGPWAAAPAVGSVEGQHCVASTLDVEAATAVLRFLESLSIGSDRRVLAPLHFQEVVYRLLRREQGLRLRQLAGLEAVRNPVVAAMDYITEHLAEPMRVSTLAGQVCLSPSAFSRLFRETTGRSPYQYVKEQRLDRGRQLLDEGRRGVSEVSRAVGYASVSHFIKEFRVRFGATPGDYADVSACRGGVHALEGPTRPEFAAAPG